MIGEGEVDEPDLRFVYTASVIRHLLNLSRTTATEEVDGECCASSSSSSSSDADDEDIDIHSAVTYIRSCMAYDGALGLNPGREGHGGSTLCGVAALHLLEGALDMEEWSMEGSAWRKDLIRWCVSRQKSLVRHNDGDNDDNDDEHDNNMDGTTSSAAAGMQGRPNKPEDTCYSYWIGGTLYLLHEAQLLDVRALREYVLSCQTPYGGFGKVKGAMPDLLHSFYSLAWLALSNELGCWDEEEKGGMNAENGNERKKEVVESIRRLSKLDCALGMCTKRVRRPVG